MHAGGGHSVHQFARAGDLIFFPRALSNRLSGLPLPRCIHDQVISIDATDACGEIPARSRAECRLIRRRRGGCPDSSSARGSRSATAGKRATSARCVALSAVVQRDAVDRSARYDSGTRGLRPASPQRAAGRVQVLVQIGGGAQTTSRRGRITGAACKNGKGSKRWLLSAPSAPDGA